MFTAARLIEFVEQRTAQHHGDVVVLWVQVPSDREAMRTSLKQVIGDRPIVPLVIRDEGFENPNAILSDLNRLVQRYQQEFEQLQLVDSGPIVILLLARTDFKLPQVASPTVFPEWFPLVGGLNVYVIIEDLLRVVDATLSAVEARVSDICESLYELETALISRLAKVRERDHNVCNAFFQLIQDEKDTSYLSFLDSAAKYAGSIHNPTGFRPSARDARAVVARLIRVASRHSPDQLGKPARALASALALPVYESLPSRESIVAVLLRSTNQESNYSIRFARNMIVSVFAASQWVTASAHADAYPRYPILLLRNMSYDLREVLAQQTLLITSLPNP